MKQKKIGLIAILTLTALVLAAPTSYKIAGKITYDTKGPTGHFKGSNDAVSGSFNWDGAGKIDGKICVDQSQWKSGEPLRDSHTREMFEVDKFAQACIDLTGVEGSAAGGSVTLVGKLNMHGVDQTIKIPLSVKTANGKLQVEGSFDTKVTDWNMKQPSLLGIKVDNNVKVMLSGEASPQ